MTRGALAGKADYEVYHVVGHGKQGAVLFHGAAGGSEELKAEDLGSPYRESRIQIGGSRVSRTPCPKAHTG